MFGKGELIMCGGHGVCRVIDITGNPIERSDRNKKYYVLEPVFEKASTIYTPVDNDKIVMRRIMNREEGFPLRETCIYFHLYLLSFPFQAQSMRRNYYRKQVRLPVVERGAKGCAFYRKRRDCFR